MPYKLLYNGASLPKTERGRSTIMKAHPKGTKFLYCNGYSVFIRDVENPVDCDVYTQHGKETSVACYAPSGFYIASADISGKVRIWDTVNPEHILKYEYHVQAGIIRDLQWTEDSKRLVVGGEGQERYAHAIMWDTGTSVGNVTSQTAAVLQVDVKQTRPFRVATGSEDYKVAFFEGPPFNFSCQKEEHTNYVNCVRFSPDGTMLASGGADGKIFIYDGKTAGLKLQLNYSVGDGRAHKGGVYGLSWHSDSTRLLSCSADKTAKIWDTKANTCLQEFKFTDNLENQQIGCLWVGENPLSVSLSGAITYLNEEDPTTPKRVLYGHNKGVISIVASYDGSTVFTGGADGLINHWESDTLLAANVKGQRHRNMVKHMSALDNIVVTCSYDDTIKIINVPEREFLSMGLGTGSQPQAVAAGKDGLILVACLGEVVVARNGKIVHTEKVQYEPSAIALHPDQTVAAVGSGVDNKIHLFEIERDVLKDAGTIEAKGPTTFLQYSRDGRMLASADAARAVKLFDSTNMDYVEKTCWVHHMAKVNAIAFSPGGVYLASCGVDGNVHVFKADKVRHDFVIKGAHSPSGNVTCVTWIDDTRLVTSCQQDCSIKVWEITSD